MPAAYIPVVAKALAKNPAQRHASMAEMVRSVELTGGATAGRAAATPAAAPAAPARPAFEPAQARSADPALTALPAEAPRTRAAELTGSMVLAVLFAALGATLWSAAVGHGRDAVELGNLFFLTVGASWAVLVPAKFWSSRRGNTWGRRVAMLTLGAIVGLQAYWLSGGTLVPPHLATPAEGEVAPVSLRLPSHAGSEAGYVSYYALAFFALRWWRMTDRRRASRFSFAPVLGAAFWGLVLTLIGPERAAWGTSVVVLVMTSAVVQLVSPWEQPPPPAAKRLRLRCA
jgi:hypothetical protein